MYKATLKGSDVAVAVKVQRPDALATISKGGTPPLPLPLLLQWCAAPPAAPTARPGRRAQPRRCLCCHPTHPRTRACVHAHADLYVLRRAVGVYQQLVSRFTAQQTDYQELLSTFAEGLYTEMDFRRVRGRAELALLTNP